MNNLKKVGLTALAGSLAIASANAAEMSVSGATVLTYTSEDGTEVTGNPLGMKTNLAFSASGDVNGYTVSYLQVSKDQFAGMSSARLSVDMGDMGTIAFDQGSGSGLATIDDKTPTAAEEIWDGLDTTTSGRVGTAGSTGVINYVNTFSGVSLNAAMRSGSGTANADGASSADGEGAWDVALTTDGSMLGMDGLSLGVGYGEADVQLAANQANGGDEGNTTDVTAFINYAMGPVTVGYQESEIDATAATADDEFDALGITYQITDSLTVGYTESNYNAGDKTADQESSNMSFSYTAGGITLAGGFAEEKNRGGETTAQNDVKGYELDLSFAF